MFKMNDLQFYVDHINKMLFKTKDPWLYGKYQAYLKAQEKARIEKSPDGEALKEELMKQR